MTEKKDRAIFCHSRCGPSSGYSPPDIYVFDNCNTNTNSYTELGNTYTNNTGLIAQIVFAGSWKFQVAEIEVFEITAETAHHPNLSLLRKQTQKIGKSKKKGRTAE
jgi:hypothetical protein